MAIRKPCGACGGGGEVGLGTCPVCNGNGVHLFRASANEEIIKCRTCGGGGHHGVGFCSTCDGVGWNRASYR